MALYWLSVTATWPQNALLSTYTSFYLTKGESFNNCDSLTGQKVLWFHFTITVEGVALTSENEWSNTKILPWGLAFKCKSLHQLCLPEALRK